MLNVIKTENLIFMETLDKRKLPTDIIYTLLHLLSELFLCIRHYLTANYFWGS